MAAAFFAGSMALAGCGMGTYLSDDGQHAETSGPGEWREYYGGPAAESWTVASTQAEWRTLWQRMGRDPPMALPAGFVGIGISLGIRSSGGYGIAIESAGLKGEAYVIRYREVVPEPRALRTMALTSPYLVWITEDPGALLVIEKVVP